MYIYNNNLLDNYLGLFFYCNFMYPHEFDDELDDDLDNDPDYQEFLSIVNTPEAIERDQYMSDYHDAMSR